jgi:hypothetical protein
MKLFTSLNPVADNLKKFINPSGASFFLKEISTGQGLVEGIKLVNNIYCS